MAAEDNSSHGWQCIVARSKCCRQRPRRHGRVVLRPGLRVRGHAAVAQVAGAPHASTASCRSRCCSWRCGGCGCTRPGPRTGSTPSRYRCASASSAHDCGPVPVRVDSRIVRRTRAAVRGRLRLDAGRPHAVRAAGRAWRRSTSRRTFRRVGVWFVLSGVFWIVGGFAEPGARLGWWALALAIELVGPLGGSGCPGSARRRLPIGTSMAATWPSAARCSSSSRSASRCS